MLIHVVPAYCYLWLVYLRKPEQQCFRPTIWKADTTGKNIGSLTTPADLQKHFEAESLASFFALNYVSERDSEDVS